MSRTPWTSPLDEAETSHWEGVAGEVAAQLADDVLSRDRANQEPVAELKLLKESGLAASRTEAERKIKEGAVSIDGKAVTGPVLNVAANARFLVRVGKRVKRVRLT